VVAIHSDIPDEEQAQAFMSEGELLQTERLSTTSLEENDLTPQQRQQQQQQRRQRLLRPVVKVITHVFLLALV